MRKNFDIIQLLFDIVQAAQHTDRVNGLQIAQGVERQTVWHLTALRGNVYVLEILLVCANEKLTKVDVNNRP